MTKEELIKKKISAISLGCDKNRVDLEHMLHSLQEYGFHIVGAPEEADIVIVNTCAFISSAVEEALENINQMLILKEQAVIEKVIVSGCLPQRSAKELANEYKEIDYILPVKENDQICKIISSLYDAEYSEFKSELGRVVTNQGKYAYLKIADGCSNGCAFCTIPRIRGRYTSVPMKQLIKEAKMLANRGYKELILVAQDTAKYGEDLYGEPKIIDLLEELCKIKEIEWIRLMYIYPEWVTQELLQFITTNKKMCPYLDMPLQHISNDILISMNRKTHEEKTRAIVEDIKTNYPSITLRSTFIVGFPGETKKQFEELCEFISEGKIDYATFFTYYKEENTKAYFMKKQVRQFVKKRRLKKIVALQNEVLNKINSSKLGTIEEVLIDEFDSENNIFIGHSKINAPNIDFCVIIEGMENQIQVGQIYKVKLVELREVGFKGEIVNEEN